MSANPILEARAVTRRFADGGQMHEAVSELSLSLRGGELWVLRGPSGSGKTTLLAMLAGVLLPTEGEVLVAGQPLSRMRDHHRTRHRRAHVGFVGPDMGLVDGMSLRANLHLPFVPQGGPDPAARARLQAQLERFELAHRAETLVGRLSTGERQRGALLRALALDPRLLVLDEPTAHLDAARAATVVDLLCALRDEGRAVLAATHDPRLALDPRVDHVAELVDGRLASGTPARGSSRPEE